MKIYKISQKYIKESDQMRYVSFIEEIEVTETPKTYKYKTSYGANHVINKVDITYSTTREEAVKKYILMWERNVERARVELETSQNRLADAFTLLLDVEKSD